MTDRELMRDALRKIAALNYSYAATNGCAYEAVMIAKDAITAATARLAEQPAPVLAQSDVWWRVEVSDRAGVIVAIEPESLIGRELADREEATIRCAIDNLVGFIGQPQGAQAGELPNEHGFEQWYVENAFDYECNPIGSRECSLARKAWHAAIAALRQPVRYSAHKERAGELLSIADAIAWLRAHDTDHEGSLGTTADSIESHLAQQQQTRCVDCHEPTSLQAVCEVCAGLRCESVVQAKQAGAQGAVVGWKGVNPRTGEPEFCEHHPSASPMRDFNMRPLVYGDGSAPPALTVSDDGYYIATFKHSGRGYVLWWAPDNNGYTPDIETAGIYPNPTPGYHDSEDCVPVPVAFVREFRVRRMIDFCDSGNEAFQSAVSLRAALESFAARKAVRS